MTYFKTLLLFIFFTSNQALSYYTTHDTGDILPKDQREVFSHIQFFTSEGLKTNIMAGYDWPSNQNPSAQYRAQIGLGHSLSAAIKYKWVPIPDYENQPSMGGIFSAQVAMPSSQTEFTLTASPLLSKRYDTNIGVNNFYASLPVSVQFYDGATNVPIQLIGGTFFKLDDYENLHFTAEIGVGLTKSFNYISLGMTLNFNKSDGIKIKKVN